LGEVNPAEPGFERDAAWRASQMKPFEEGGQKAGQRYSGGRDTTHAVLYALDPMTGDEIYSSGDAMDSWNHYGGMALSDGNIYISTWDARVFAFGLKK
jgi:outer membrane protein assembly factor BamB